MVTRFEVTSGVAEALADTSDDVADVRAYSPDRVAKLLDISRRQVYELMSSGELQSFKVRTLRRIRHTDLRAFIERKQP